MSWNLCSNLLIWNPIFLFNKPTETNCTSSDFRVKLADPNNKEAINQNTGSFFPLFFITYHEPELFPVVLDNPIFWQAWPLPCSSSQGSKRSLFAVESDLSRLAFSKSTHAQTTQTLHSSAKIKIQSNPSCEWGGRWALSTQTTPAPDSCSDEVGCGLGRLHLSVPDALSGSWRVSCCWEVRQHI